MIGNAELMERLRCMSPRLDMLDCENVLTAADRIEKLVKERDVSNELGKALEEDAGQLRDKLAKAVAGLKPLVQICEMMRDGSGYRKDRYQHEVTDTQWSAWCKQIKTARAVLAELGGGGEPDQKQSV